MDSVDQSTALVDMVSLREWGAEDLFDHDVVWQDEILGKFSGTALLRGHGIFCSMVSFNALSVSYPDPSRGCK